MPKDAASRVYIILYMYDPRRKCKRKVKVACWSAPMYPAFIGTAQLIALIELRYPKAGNGRSPVGVERMQRIYFLQQWFNLSDPALEESLYGSASMRQFVMIARSLPFKNRVCMIRTHL